jgi:hypothetical protein
MGGLAVGAVVIGTHSLMTPPDADIQAMPAGNKDIDAAERRASIISVGVVAGVSLLARDVGILVIGTGFVVALALASRHANWTESGGGKYLSPAEASSAGSANTGPQVDTAPPASTQPYSMYQGQSEFVGG